MQIPNGVQRRFLSGGWRGMTEAALTQIREQKERRQAQHKRGRFGSRGGLKGWIGVGSTEVVEDVGEVGEVDGWGMVEVAGGPGGSCGAEILEDGVEVGGVDMAVDVGVA